MPQYLLKFLGADLTSISATEYAIIVIVLHTFLLSTFGLLMVNPEARWMLENDNPSASIQFQIGTRSVMFGDAEWGLSKIKYMEHPRGWNWSDPEKWIFVFSKP